MNLRSVKELFILMWKLHKESNFFTYYVKGGTNMKRRFCLVFIVLLLVVVLAGCGQSQEKAQAEPEVKVGEKEVIKEVEVMPEVVPLTEQVKKSGHYSFFEKRLTSEGYYADRCIECHSAVKRLDDHNAVIADFKEGGKYAPDRANGEIAEGITCRVCHVMDSENLFALRESDPVQACGTCHTGEGIELGHEVHHPQAEVFKGVAIGDLVSETPSGKYEHDYSCFDCHFTNNLDHDFMPPKPEEIVVNKECSTCHKEGSDKDPGKLIATIQESVKEELEPLSAWLSEAGKMVNPEEGESKLSEEAKNAYGNALTLITLVEADKSYGVHNPEYIELVLKAAKEQKTKFEELTK